MESLSGIERYMALRKARATKVKRAIFGSITTEDRQRTAAQIAQLSSLTDLNAKSLYNFDFASDKPLTGGRFEWEKVIEAPQPYSSRLSTNAKSIPVTTCTFVPITHRSRKDSVEICSRADYETCDMDNQDSTVPHDSGFITDYSSDEENSTATATSSSPCLTSLKRKSTIPDYFRQKKLRSAGRVKRLQ